MAEMFIILNGWLDTEREIYILCVHCNSIAMYLHVSLFLALLLVVHGYRIPVSVCHIQIMCPAVWHHPIQTTNSVHSIY